MRQRALQRRPAQVEVAILQPQILVGQFGVADAASSCGTD